MKKLLSILILTAILLSCCACAKQVPAQTAPIVRDEHDMTVQELYGHIDQTQPVDGVYKLWNKEGIAQLSQHPDASFEILCDIDLEGATLAPIPEFTGALNGGNFVLKNFTLAGSGESIGFVAINEGQIQNLLLENVTLTPGSDAKNIGLLAGENRGSILRCNISGAIAVETAGEAACGGITGVNTGSLNSIAATVDMTYTAQPGAFVGGLVGKTRGGTVEYCENHGKLTVTGQNKTTGLFAGDAVDTVFVSCVFGGADNSLDGKYFTNFTGNPDDDELAVAENALWRDNASVPPLPDNVMAVRQKVVDAMYDMCTVEWKVKQDLVHTCTCQLESCHGTYSELYTYYGVPYNHKRSSLARFTYCQDENGYLQDWIYGLDSYDGFDIYMGNDCSAALQQAWLTVCNDAVFTSTRQMPEVYGKGTIAVGDYVCDFELQPVVINSVTYRLTDQYVLATDYQVMMESYAAMRPGDAIVNQVEAGGHTRMIASYPVVVRDQEGKINANYSYVLTHEQGAGMMDEENMSYTSCRVNYKYTFANLYEKWYCPITNKTLLTGEMETPTATLEGGCGGYAGMYTGKVQANYSLDYVTLKITDDKGDVLLEKPFFPTVQKISDYGGMDFAARAYVDSMDIADLAMFLPYVSFTQGQTYHYTVTANLATFDNIVVNEGSFTYG